MSTYRFVAVNSEGKRIEGERDAPTVDALAAALTAEGLQVEQIDFVGPASRNSGPSPLDESPAHTTIPARSPADDVPLPPEVTLTHRDAQIVTQRLTDVTSAGLPLVNALYAMAQEMRHSRAKRYLLRMCRLLESGRSLDEVLASSQGSHPPHLAAMIRAGTRSGNVASLLDDYLTTTRQAAAYRRAAWLSLSYPICLVLLCFLLMSALLVGVVPQFANIFDAFGTELPALTSGVVEFSNLFRQFGLWFPLLLLVPLGILWGATELAGGRRFRRQLVCGVPGLGGLLRLASLTEFANLLGLLLEAEVPMPEALQLAGQQAHDAEINEAARTVAEDVSTGADVSGAAMGLPAIPHGLRHLFRLMDTPRGIPERLRAAAAMFSARAEVQSSALPQILEPLIIVFVGLCFGLVLLALYLPLFKLLNDLS